MRGKVQTMTDRDRLIELVDKAKEEYAGDVTDHTETDYIVKTLLNEGVIVPPCKVGDKIYMLVTRHTVCFEYPNGKMQRVENQHTFIKETCLTKANFFKVLDDFGKTIFLTKEEAEQKLKELG